MSKWRDWKDLNEMEALRFEEFWSLDEIARKFGLTRQRIHQLLPAHNGREIQRLRTEKDIRNREPIVVDLYRNGALTADIGKELNIPQQVVRDVLRRNGIDPSKRRKPPANRVSDETLSTEIRECAKELGKTPGAKAFDKWRGYMRAQLIIIRSGTWAKACEAAGLEPNIRRGGGERKYTDQMIQATYDRARAELGRIPTYELWEQGAYRPAAASLRRRFGSWMKFLDAMENRKE